MAERVQRVASAAGTQAGSPPFSRRYMPAAACVALVALALRLNPGLTRDFWEDEVIAAGHAEQPFWRLPAEVTRADVHPFLYFLQLHAWSLFGDGDLWLRLNSVTWNLLAIASLFVVARRLYGRREAWVVGTLLALCAPVVWMSQEVRPYSWLLFLLVWAFYSIERPFGPVRGAVASFALCVAIIYSHAIGFFAVFMLGSYALGRTIGPAPTRGALTRWALLYGACAVAAVPPLLSDIFRDANLGATASVTANLAAWIPHLLMPRGDSPILLALAAAVTGGAVALTVAARRTRLMACMLVVLPIAVALVLHASGFGIFKLNAFSTFLVPFLILALSRLIGPLTERRAILATGVLAALFTGLSMEFFLARADTTGFRAASRFIRSEIKPGDVVYVPQQSMFWGMARYMGVSQRGWQLAVAPALSPQWQRMYDRIGPRLVTAFDLEPRTQTIMTQDGIALLVGNDTAGLAAQAPRVWLVTYARADLPAGFPPPGLGTHHLVDSRAIGFLQASLYE